MTEPTTRFRPTRAGIVNLWDYTNQTFSFAGGRLVLRGANGSGKTKALEVLFPFVLDGRLDPRRLDPFSGENRTMKENLLWRGTDSAYGYAWLEFGDGTTHVTVGVGLRAQRHQPSPRSWFFVADGRVGDDIALVEPDGRPSTKGQLAEALGDGVVVEQASEHRRRIDQRLFGLGTERYEAMLDLVLTLRRPMLAKDLDPRLLSETLAKGLRPLDDALLEQVARSFDDLDAVQRDLDRLVAADDAAQRFVADYRGYLRSQARHRADGAIDATAEVRRGERRLSDAGADLDAARADEAMAETEHTANDERLAADRARRDALKASDAFKTAGQLEHLDRAVHSLAEGVTRAEGLRERADRAAERAATEHDGAERAHGAAGAEVARVGPRVVASAADAGVEWVGADGDGPASDVRRRVGGRATARRADLDAVRQRLAAVDDADRRVTLADTNAAGAEEAAERATTALADAGTTVDDARRSLTEAVRSWGDTHADVVDPAEVDALVAVIEHAGEPAAPGLPEAWGHRLGGRRTAVEVRRAGLVTDARNRDDQVAGLDARRAAIHDEHDDAPPTLPWRGERREARHGAPLWRLVRFADGVPAAEAAGIEAALEAAGLLDAWVSPDGAVPDDVPDAFLVPTAASPTRTLADVLVAEDQDVVATDHVTAVLASIGIPTDDTGGDRPGSASVSASGRYALGPLVGTHAVPAVRYIGATARAAHRAARIATLDAEIAEIRAEQAAIARQVAEAEAWLAAADAATAALPRATALDAAVRSHDRAAGTLQAARTTLADARATAETARREANDQRARLQREAQHRALPASADGLVAVEQALDRFKDDGRDLAAAIELVDLRHEALVAARQRLATTAEELQAAHDAVVERRREHEARAVELATLRETMGADVTAVLAELAEVDDAIHDGDGAQRRLATAVRDAAAERGKAEGEVRAACEAVETTQAAAAEALRRLGVLRRPDLAGPLGLPPDLEPAPAALLDAVDAVATGVSADEGRRKGATTRVTKSLEDLQNALGSGYRPSWDVDDDVIVVTVADEIGVRPVGTFADGLATQRAEQETLLSARERALFEDALLASVCAQIHARTLATRDLVASMDAEMRARRLSSGQTVGVAWRAEDGATPDWKVVHRLLDQDPAHFGPDQLETLRRHFAAEIKAARAAEPQSNYRELLARVLDYRSWRRFELFLVEADGSEAPLTRARHARLSGGEKAASLHLPLFAAAHAAFAAARPDCPRLLGLDEAFAGIDDQGRSELLSLTVAFELDLFMTGYDLWAVDRSVPAVAHYDLLHLVDEHAVSSLLVLWNGAELIEGPDAELALAALGNG